MKKYPLILLEIESHVKISIISIKRHVKYSIISIEN